MAKSYKKGDRWSARDATRVSQAADRVEATPGGGNPNVKNTLVTSTVALAPFSCFSLGSTDANVYDELSPSKVLTPIDNASGVLYTNGDLDVGANSEFLAYPITWEPVKLRSVDLSPGDKAGPDSTGQAVATGSDLIAVKSATGGFGMFIYSPASTGEVILGTNVSDIERDSTGTMNVYSGTLPTDSGETLEYVFDWLSQQKISAGKEIAVKEFNDSGKYFRVLWAECEDPPVIQTGD